MQTKHPCQTINAWLKANLGKHACAPLTGTDARALWAAVQIVELWSCCYSKDLFPAFGAVVRKMQPSTQELAYHAVAHVVNWEDRAMFWREAGLEPLEHVRVCDWEPGGARRCGTAVSSEGGAL